MAINVMSSRKERSMMTDGFRSSRDGIMLYKNDVSSRWKKAMYKQMLEENELAAALSDPEKRQKYLSSLQYYPASEMCYHCKGKCCIHGPGINVPEDFPPPIEISLPRAIKSGKYVICEYIDWDPDEPLYFIRPASQLGKKRRKDSKTV